MNVWTAHLWKECREQKALLLGFLILTPALLGLTKVLLPASVTDVTVLVPSAAMAGLLIATLAIGGDLVPAEIRGGGMRILLRQPQGLWTPFTVKLVVFLASLAAFASWAFLCAHAFAVQPIHSRGFVRDLIGPHWFHTAVVLALWTFATSCMLPRGALALPGAAVLCGILLAPVGYTVFFHRGMPLTMATVIILECWLAVTALGTAAVAFTFGLRNSGRAWSCAWRGLAVATVLVSPCWGWVAQRHQRYVRLNPADSTFRIGQTYLGEAARYAFVTAHHDFEDRTWFSPDGMDHALVVDLEEGNWRKVPGQFIGSPWFGRDGQRCVSQIFLVQDPDARGPSDGSAARIDTTTGLQTECGEGDLKSMYEFFEPESSRLRLADGRHMFQQHKELFIVELDGSTRELGDSQATPHWYPAGQGFHCDSIAYDPARERRVDLPANPLQLYIRPGRWLIETGRKPASLASGSSSTDKSFSSGTGNQRLLCDPDTKEVQPVSLAPFDILTHMLDDGRFFVLHKQSVSHQAGKSERSSTDQAQSKGDLDRARKKRTVRKLEPYQLVIWTPETDQMEPVELPRGEGPGVWMFHFSGRTSDGRPVYNVRTEQRSRSTFARFDPASNRLDFASGDFEAAHAQYLGSTSPDTFYVVDDHRRIVRMHLDGTPTEVLFPR